MTSLYIERQDAACVTLEGRRVPRAEVARFIKVGREDFATITDDVARRYGLLTQEKDDF